MSAILVAQGLEHSDHDAVYRTLNNSFIKAGPWAEHVDGDGRPDWERMMGGPLPDWMSTWAIWQRQWEITFAEHGLVGDVEQAADHTRAQLSAAEAYPDAHETIERLAAAGFTLALLSNADEDFLQSALSRAQLRFSVIQTSESLRAYKPHRSVFLALCQRLGMEPREVLYVGDSLPTDVHGAHNAGLRTAWVRRSERPLPQDSPGPDIELPSLSLLADLLETR